jgi:hypothetical protein
MEDLCSVEDNRDAYYVKVIFKKTKETHDGYCSDPYDICTEKTTVTKNLPIPDWLNDSDIDIDGKVDIDTQFRFNKEKGCNQGSGYCGCETTYITKSAKVKKRFK